MRWEPRSMKLRCKGQPHLHVGGPISSLLKTNLWRPRSHAPSRPRVLIGTVFPHAIDLTRTPGRAGHIRRTRSAHQRRSSMSDASTTAGTITDLDVQTNDSDRLSVFLDGEFAFGVHQDLVVKHGLRVGETLTLEEQQAVEAEDQTIRAKQRALDYLAYKPRTEQEVRRKLTQEDVPATVVEDVIARIQELGYLDDETYAHDYARNRFANKRYGPERIRRELRERGIDRHLADEAVEEVFADEDPVEVARSHAEKRWSRIAHDDDPRRQKQKLYRYLTRRGFTSDTVYRIIDEFVDERVW